MHPYALFPRNPGLFSSLNVQRNMLEDIERRDKFKEAIFKIVRPGDVVIDLGTGTGVLAIWAAEAGARKVYAIEETDVADLATDIIRDNGFGDRIEVLKMNSAEISLPERADVLLAELVGHFLFEEGIVEAIAGVRDAWLKPGARIIPAGATVYLAPACLGERFREVTFWDTWTSPRLAAARKWAANTAYVETVKPDELRAEPCKAFQIDFSNDAPQDRISNVSFVATSDGDTDTLAGWFDLDLAPGIILSSSPWAPPTHWQQCVFPLEAPVHLANGNRLECSFRVNTFSPGATWTWRIRAGRTQEVHTFAITYQHDPRAMRETF